ncbi:hypothetical protein L6452_14518 [Arctium lappa]|uniref:Uncharacterized protein n=1 Tax=Arctium lappa TaxID=4217 RepID=A0ACB9CL89_ARCLA|nr:hypothetical protein L6452_14518 [Arctium lappa]
MDSAAAIVRVKKEHPTDDSHIILKVMSQLNELDQYFRVKCDEPLLQLMMRWCHRAGIVDYRTIRFCFDGTRIDENKTANEMGLTHGDSIDTFVEQIGAGHLFLLNDG